MLTRKFNEVLGPNEPDRICPNNHFDFAGGRIEAALAAGNLVWEIPWKYFACGEEKEFIKVEQAHAWKSRVNPDGLAVIKGTRKCGTVRGILNGE